MEACGCGTIAPNIICLARAALTIPGAGLRFTKRPNCKQGSDAPFRGMPETHDVGDFS
jgi:hypothetical protein